MTSKASFSTLNPYAKEYVPIALKEASSEIPDAAGFQKLSITDNSKLKAQKDDHPLPTACHPNQVASMNFTDVEFEMDLAYLQMSFPDLSEKSIIDIYSFNDADLEASLDMLIQLESTDCLPDALDIGDVPEAAPSGECSTTKIKNVVGESRTSYTSSDKPV